ncbi:MAG: methyl-accepting chemotaxis protein, partial [Herbaspirillum sp.]
MNLLPDVRIGTRLGVGFAIVLVLLLVSTSFALFNARSNAAATKDMLQNPLVRERVVSDWHDLVNIAVARTAMIARSSDETLFITFSDVIADNTRAVEGVVKKLTPLLQSASPAEVVIFKSIAGLQARYEEATKAVMNAKASGQTQEAERLYSENFEPAAKAYQNKMKELVASERKAIDDTGHMLQRSNNRSSILLILLGLLSVAIGGVCAWLITRSIVRPLHDAVGLASRVAAGDLSEMIEVRTQDETGQLFQALKNMNESLAGIVSQVRLGTATITNASAEIAAGNMDLSSRTEQQASSLEETASSMEELTSTVKQNADNARQANQLAVSASEVAVQGGNVVAQVVETMSSINTSSKKIVDIISVIDGIAFQTNILALNAAVEAARAGEQGRGFAVVAAEVRNLAQRSASAAKEIKQLISDSVEKVDCGTRLVDQAGSTMSEIVASVKRVTDIIGEISAASAEQTSGIEQINEAINQMDQVTQQNAALVEQ